MTTKLPSIPSFDGENVGDVLSALTEATQVRVGVRGDALDAGVTFRDLAGIGLVQEAASTGSGAIQGLSAKVNLKLPDGEISPIYDGASDLTTPPAPTELKAVAVFDTVFLSWNVARFSNPSYYEVYRAFENDLSIAQLAGTSTSQSFTDIIGESRTLFYWVRTVSQAGVRSAWNSAQGTEVKTGVDPAKIIPALQGQVLESSLSKALASRIADTFEQTADLVETYGSTMSAAQSAANAATAQAAAVAAKTAALLAQTGAETARDAAVVAKTSAETAQAGASTSATQASQSATGAAGSAASAATSATAAANSANAAGGSATAAATSATNANTYATAAETASTASSNAKVAAESARDAASASATAAATSASTASTKATEAGQSASAASTSATNASTSAGNASTSATNAATSETNASGSANNAATSASAAATSATNAGNSATAAATSATTATTKATAAEQSATAANVSKVAAETAATNAANSASAAATSATTATTKATEAGTSATTASTQATNAATSASSAGTFATNASNSATNASGSANSAASSLTQLYASLQSAGLIYNSSFANGSSAGWTGISSVTSSPYGSMPRSYAGVQTTRDAFFPETGNIADWFPCNPGEEFEVSAWVSAQYASPRLLIGIQYERNNGDTNTWTGVAETTAPTTAKFLRGYWTAPADARRVRFWSQINTFGTENPWHITDAQLRRNDARTAAVQVQATATASAVTGLSAQYTVKIDNVGWVSGFGLASETINGTPFSQFNVRADRFSITNPAVGGQSITAVSAPTSFQLLWGVVGGHGVSVGDKVFFTDVTGVNRLNYYTVTGTIGGSFFYTNRPGGESPSLTAASKMYAVRVPFIVQDGKTYIDVAVIKDADISDAKIGSVAAKKITAGYINASIAINGAQVYGSSLYSGGTTTVTTDANGNVTAFAATNPTVAINGGNAEFVVGSFKIKHLATANTTTTPFEVVDDVVRIKTALIGDGTIGMAKIAETIESTNYANSAAGWQLTKAGAFNLKNGTITAGLIKSADNKMQIDLTNGFIRIEA